MKRIAITAVAALLAVSAHAAGTVQCSFVNPDRFTDVRDRTYSAEHNLKTLQEIVVSVAAPYVPDGQTLKVDVLDVDLAGEVRPGARAWDVRVLRGSVDWPRITLRWSLEGAGGQASRSGEAVVQDMAYLTRIAPPLASTSLIYERRMLAEWFRTQFGKAGAG
jgi:Protein of unknown function (DUF3016)